jgi:hypothetical protein
MNQNPQGQMQPAQAQQPSISDTAMRRAYEGLGLQASGAPKPPVNMMPGPSQPGM